MQSIRFFLVALAASIDGTVILPVDEQYDVIRKILNARDDSKPAVIVQAATTADLELAILFTTQFGIPLSVRSNGRRVSGSAGADGGVMVDLSQMTWIEVDVEAPVMQA